MGGKGRERRGAHFNLHVYKQKITPIRGLSPRVLCKIQSEPWQTTYQVCNGFNSKGLAE